MRAFWLALIIAAFTNGPAIGDTLMATRTIRSKTILTAADVFVVKDDLPAIFDSADDVIGLEARVVLYQGRPTARGCRARSNDRAQPDRDHRVSKPRIVDFRRRTRAGPGGTR